MYVGARSLGKVAAKRGESFVPAEATQAQMEAATATGVYVSPANAKHHPGTAKAVVFFTTTGGTATGSAITTGFSHNVTVTKMAGPAYVFTWGTAFASGTKYGVLAIGQRDNAGNTDLVAEYLSSGSAQTTSAAKLVFHVAGTKVNPVRAMVVAYGDQ